VLARHVERALYARRLQRLAGGVERAGLLRVGDVNSMWESLIWAKLKMAGGPAASAASAPIGRDESTPPLTDHSRPVPVDAMH
jgi:hypothetical protein